MGMAEATMTLQYEGPAVESGAMDVRQLAPALIATADVIREAHVFLGVPGPAPQVEVRATRPGSFIVDLLVADGGGVARNMLDMLVSRPSEAAADLSGLVTLVVSSVGAVRWLRNRRITATEQVSPGRVRIVLDNNTTLEIEPEALRLMMDAEYRRSLRAMIAPVTDTGISSLTVSTENRAETVSTTDGPAFEVPPTVEERLGESVTEVVLRPVNVAFTEGNKWRFNDGESTFHAAIHDVGFLSRVDAGTERFAKNDMLRVRLHTRQTRDADGLHTERTVTEVLDHLSGAVQLDLFGDSGD